MNYDPKTTLQDNHNAEEFQETAHTGRDSGYIARTGIDGVCHYKLASDDCGSGER